MLNQTALSSLCFSFFSEAAFESVEMNVPCVAGVCAVQEFRLFVVNVAVVVVVAVHKV